MAQDQFKGKLTTIFSADVAGYSRLMGENEAATVKTLDQYKQVMSELIRQHRGWVIDSPGDNLLAEFTSVIDAVQCAVATQKELQACNTELPENRRMQFRIGVNLGDLIEEEYRIYGDGVSIAARLESLADPGGICVSKTVFDHIESKLPFGYQYLGEQTVKNILKPVEAYKVLMEPRVTTVQEQDAASLKSKPRRTSKIALACAAALLIAIGSALVWQFDLPKALPLENKVDLRKVAFPVADKPSIAVLPFQNMTGDLQQEYFSEGMADQIITGVSQSPDIFVTSRTSSFAYKDKFLTAQQIADRLGVRYVLEGSVQRDVGVVRINVQLIDGRNGTHIWANHYDYPFVELFALQDRITMEVMEILNVEFTEGVSATNLSSRLRHYRPKSLNAYEYWLKGVYHFFKRTRQDSIAARQLFEDAIKLDPDFAAAYRQLGFAYLDEVWFHISKSPEKSIERAEKSAQKYTALSPDQPSPYGLLSMIHLLKKDLENAILYGEKAVELNPNDDSRYFSLGLALSFAGRYIEAIINFQTALRLAPLRPPHLVNNLAWAYLGIKQYDKAILLWFEAIERNQDCLFSYKGLTAAYEFSGHLEKACWAAENLMRVNPKYTIAVEKKMMPIKDEVFKKRLLDAYCSAGLK